MMLQIVLAFIAGGTLNTIVQCWFRKKDKEDSANHLARKTLAAITYWALSSDLDRLILKGYATADERKTLTIMYEVYKENGWNGDMEERMKKVYYLPLHKEDEYEK